MPDSVNVEPIDFLQQHMRDNPSVGVDFRADIWADEPGLFLAENQPDEEELLGPLTILSPGFGAFQLIQEDTEDGYVEWQICFHWRWDELNRRFEWYVLQSGVCDGGTVAYHGIGCDVREEKRWTGWDLARTRDDILRSIGWVCQQHGDVLLGLEPPKKPLFCGICIEQH